MELANRSYYFLCFSLPIMLRVNIIPLVNTINKTMYLKSIYIIKIIVLH